MKTMKKLQVAVAAASVFAAGHAMAASINQSGLTIAREAISANTASTQVVRAPTATFNFDNGPAANAASTQDFNVTLTLAGDGDAMWDTAKAISSAYKTIGALRRNNGNTVVEVVPDTAGPFANKVYLVLMGVDVVPAGSLGNQPGDSITAGKTLRYKFRLVNNTAATVGIGDLQLNFHGQNPGANTTDAAFQTGFGFVNPVPNDYQQIKNLAAAANATTVATGAGTTGDTDGSCGEGIRKITLTARNYNGSGDGVQGESAGASGSSITNQGYVQFQTALRVIVDKGVAVDRNTDPLNTNSLLVPNGAGNASSMALGTVRFANRNLNAWDVSEDTAYYQYSATDLNAPSVVQNGQVDVGSPAAGIGALTLKVTGTNGFASGAKFRLSNNPSCIDTAAPVLSTTWVTPTVTANTNAGPNGADAVTQFSLAELITVFGAGTSLTDVVSGGPQAAPFGTAGNYPTDRAYICMQVPGGGVLIPQSRFTGIATLNKEDTTEQSNASCPAPLAGLGGGIKIDVRNFTQFPADSDYRDYIRIINNSENVTADITVQYIMPNGKYGRYVSLGQLAPREAKFWSDRDIKAAMEGSAGKESLDANAAAAGAQVLPVNAQGRLRVSSEAASTLRVQNYFYSVSKNSLSEVSASQGADFVNVEASQRDHIDQDAQTGIKK